VWWGGGEGGGKGRNSIINYYLKPNPDCGCYCGEKEA